MDAQQNNEDRAAELKFVQEIADCEYNREFTIEARPEGLLVDESVLVPWEWILNAFVLVGSELSETSQALVLAAPCNSETKQIESPNKSKISDR